MTNEIKGKSLLVVDDDKITRIGVKYMLEAQGYRVEEAESGEVAISKFMASPSFYHLILIDYNMPGMDGLATTQELRKLEENTQKMLIIGNTAQVDKTVIEKCLQAGMNAVISKPINIEMLAQIIEKFNNC